MRNVPVLALAVCAAAFGQEKTLEFEVATVKPSASLDAGGGRVMVRVGERNDGAMVIYDRMTLKQLAQDAYRVKGYQISCPAWMDTLQFDISAKLPEGATKDQAPDMLQNLLKERFKLALHREKKDFPVFALMVAKSGAKLKTADPNNAFPPPPGGMPPPPPGRGAEGRVSAPPAEGATRMMMTPSGGHFDARGITLGRLAEMVSTYVERPVIDETGVDGKYDFSLDVAPEEMANMSGMKGAMMMAGRGMQRPDGPPPDGASAEPHASILQSIQSYGLRLEPKKAPLDLIVLDSAEKNPVQN